MHPSVPSYLTPFKCKQKHISSSTLWPFYSHTICHKQTQIVESASLSLVLISRHGPQSCLHTPPFRLNEKINELGWARGNTTTFSVSESSVHSFYSPPIMSPTLLLSCSSCHWYSSLLYMCIFKQRRCRKTWPLLPLSCSSLSTFA